MTKLPTSTGSIHLYLAFGVETAQFGQEHVQSPPRRHLLFPTKTYLRNSASTSNGHLYFRDHCRLLLFQDSSSLLALCL